MPKRYVKSDIVDKPYFTKGKPYEVLRPESIGVLVKDDDDRELVVVPDNVFEHECWHLDDKDTWKWCDENGNEL